MSLEALRDSMLVLGQKARHILKHTELDLSRKRTFRDKNNYRTELIQVAAVALAALTDLDMAETGWHDQVCIEELLWAEILDERERQDTKFGRQLPIELDPEIWGAVLIEEVAEVLAEIEP